MSFTIINVLFHILRVDYVSVTCSRLVCRMNRIQCGFSSHFYSTATTCTNMQSCETHAHLQCWALDGEGLRCTRKSKHGLVNVSFCELHQNGITSYQSYKRVSKVFRSSFIDGSLETPAFTAMAQLLNHKLDQMPNHLHPKLEFTDSRLPYYITRSDAIRSMIIGRIAVQQRRMYTRSFIYRGTDSAHTDEENSYSRHCDCLQMLLTTGKVSIIFVFLSNCGVHIHINMLGL